MPPFSIYILFNLISIIRQACFLFYLFRWQTLALRSSIYLAGAPWKKECTGKPLKQFSIKNELFITCFCNIISVLIVYRIMLIFGVYNILR